MVTAITSALIHLAAFHAIVGLDTMLYLYSKDFQTHKRRPKRRYVAKRKRTEETKVNDLFETSDEDPLKKKDAIYLICSLSLYFFFS